MCTIQRSARLLARPFRLLRHELRTAKIGVRESENKKLVRIRVRSVEILQEVVIVGHPQRVHCPVIFHVRAQRQTLQLRRNLVDSNALAY